MNEKRKDDALIKNALVVSFGGIVVKLLGALYRIPLSNLLGTEGLGVYQTAFPTYLILMTLIGSAATTALTRIISAKKNGERILFKSLGFFLPLGIVGSAIMIIFARPLSCLQGCENARFAYVALAPSLFFVSLISSIRGFFQGSNDMKPTAISQIIEQAAKIVFALGLIFLFGKSSSGGAALACLAVSIGELCAAAYLFILFLKRKNDPVEPSDFSIKELIVELAPIAAISAIFPLSKLFDSFTVVNILSASRVDSARLYGVYSGGVETLIGAPVAVAYGIAAASVPDLSRKINEGREREAKKGTIQAIALTLLFSSLSQAFLAAFSSAIVGVFYPKFESIYKLTTSKLLSIASVNVVLLSLEQTLTAILIARKKAVVAAVSSASGLIVKIAIQPILLGVDKINIFGVLYSDILCYLVAIFINLVYIISILYNKNNGKHFNETYVSGRRTLPERYVSESLGRSEKRR